MSDDRLHSDVVPADGGDRSLASRLAQMKDHLAAAWRTGREPRLETYLAGFDSADQLYAFRQLLETDIECRRRRREKPNIGDYRARFPQFAALLESVFGSMDLETTLLEDKPRSGVDASSEETVVADAPKYAQLEFHASGGLGEIFRARDEHLKRDVALKFIQDRYLGDLDSRGRFFLEAEITGRLDHPGVVPVYSIGNAPDGRPFYAMRFIEGATLRQAVDNYHRADWKARGATARRLELHRLLSHLVAACNTIAYSHNRGVVHRDIKPDNIMIGRYQETLVLDWGLALSVERDERARASGEKTLMPGGGPTENSSVSGAGTIGYMSPEQLPDSLVPAGPASDVYSLGATLYRILVGSAPIQGPPDFETWRRIREGDYRRVREANPLAPRPLAAICERAMRPRPEDRYASALDLAADLQNWMADEPVSVYHEPPLERTLRWSRRHRSWTASLAVAAALVLAVSFLASLVLGRVAQSERDVRMAALQRRDQSLRQSSMFAARTIPADDIDRSWRILTERAADSELHTLLKAAAGAKPGSRQLKELQAWLDRAYLDSQIADKSDSWFITDRSGVQLARTPYSKKTIGENFAHRDYFHGLGRDLRGDADRAGIEPIRDVRLSICYRSQTDAATRVAFSVPIWEDGDDSPSSQPLGVLGMSVITGQFELLDNALLVDTRTDTVSGSERKGLVLQHPRLPDAASTANVPLPRLDRVWVQELEKLTDKVLSERSSRHSERLRLGTLVHNFPDPLDRPGSPPRTASISPVIIETRGNKPLSTGLVVIVMEQTPAPEPEPELGTQ